MSDGESGGDSVRLTVDGAISGGGERAEEPERLRRCFEPPDLALEADVARLDSDLSAGSLPALAVPARDVDDPLGLSVFALPGIFERIEPRMDREDSLVSDLLKAG